MHLESWMLHVANGILLRFHLLLQGLYKNGFFSLYMQQSDGAHHRADRDNNSFQLGPLHLGSHSPPFSSFSWQNHFSARFISLHHSRSFSALSRRVCSVYVSASPSDPAWGQKDSCDSILKVKIWLRTDRHERE